MKQLTCEMCGSTELLKKDGIFVCQTCGTKYSVEEAKKMMIEGTVEVSGTVKIDDSGNVEKLYSNIVNLRELGEINRALELAEQFVSTFPLDYRGWWILLECQTNNFSIVFPSMGFDFVKCFTNAVKCCTEKDIIATFKVRYDEWYKKRYDALCDIKLKFNNKNRFFYDDILLTEPFYLDGIENAKKCNEKNGVYKALGMPNESLECYVWEGLEKITLYAREILFINGKTAIMKYTGKYVKIRPAYFENIINKNIDKYISMLNEKSTKKNKGGCYVATAVYGSYDCPQVWTLRRYRDNTLAGTWYGRAFIHTYYAISPTLVKWFDHTKWFEKILRRKLDKMVLKLQNDGVESTPYEDRNW